MSGFKRFLNEGAGQFATTDKAIRAALMTASHGSGGWGWPPIKSLTIKNGVVSLDNRNGEHLDNCFTFTSPSLQNGHLPVRFGEIINGRFRIDSKFQPVRTLEGMPTVVICPGLWGLELSGKYELPSLKYLTPIIRTDLDLSSMDGLPTFSGFHNFVKECMKVALPDHYDGPLMSIMMVKGQSRELYIPNYMSNTPLSAAMKIINKHMAEGNDVLACQEELIDNDLERYADL